MTPVETGGRRAGPGPVPVAASPGAPAGVRLVAPQAAVPEAFVDQLRAELGPEAVTSDLAELDAAGRDWWPLSVVWATEGLVPARPGLVARPADTTGVAAVVRMAGEHGVPVTPAAGRSGVCGGAVPVAGGVALDLTGLAGLVDTDDTSLLVRARAGTFGDDLERELAEQRMTLGHWPQSMALSTVGGWLACRSAGQYSTRYGKIEDMVVGLEVVDGRGRVLRTGGAPRAAVGPDLTQVFVGSEGTLGIITEATLRAWPRPAGTGWGAYSFASFADGLDVLRRTLRRGATPAVLRLYDQAETARHFGEDGPLLLVLDEGDPELVDWSLHVVNEEAHRTPGYQKRDRRLVGHWLEHRNEVSALGSAINAGLVVDTIEVAGTWRALPGLYESVRAAVAAVPGTLGATGHCSHAYRDGGCLYFTFAGLAAGSFDSKDGYYQAALTAALDATLAAGGALSHHHGIGLARARWLRPALGDAAFEALVGLKAALDPHGILNPGKLGLPSPFLPAGWDWAPWRSSRRRPGIDLGAVRQGAILGLFVIVPATIIQEVVLAAVDDPCNDPVVFPIFAIILAAFFVAGHRAARAAADSPYTHGVLGALGALAVWLPVRLVKNVLFGGAFVSDDCGADSSGFLAVVISVVTVALLAMSVGIVGGLVAARRRPDHD